jgi:hypothetical protein
MVDFYVGKNSGSIGLNAERKTAAPSVDIEGGNSAIAAIRNIMQCTLVIDDDHTGRRQPENVSMRRLPYKQVDDLAVIFLRNPVNPLNWWTWRRSQVS